MIGPPSMPRIAAGLGGLDWQDVRLLIRNILGPIGIPVYVYEEYKEGLKATECAT